MIQILTLRQKNVLEVYNEAKKLRENSKKKNELYKAILSCDEKTGIQAIGNKYPDLEPIRKVFGLRFRVICGSDKTKKMGHDAEIPFLHHNHIYYFI